MKNFNLDYQFLINKVRKIDEDAASYLENEAPNLYSFVPTKLLCNCFFWADSPQGILYWTDIAIALGEMGDVDET